MRYFCILSIFVFVFYRFLFLNLLFLTLNTATMCYPTKNPCVRVRVMLSRKTAAARATMMMNGAREAHARARFDCFFRRMRVRGVNTRARAFAAHKLTPRSDERLAPKSVHLFGRQCVCRQFGVFIVIS